MKILGLPGVKFETHQWMQDLFSDLHAPSFEFRVAHYRHWSQAQDPDVSYEASCYVKKSVDFVIAKSLGTYISTIAFDSFNFRAQKAIFIGTPIKRHRANNFMLLLNFVKSVPTVFIQQTSDFNGSFLELSEVIQRQNNATAIEVPGDDHQYDDIKGLQKIISSVLKNHT